MYAKKYIYVFFLFLSIKLLLYRIWSFGPRRIGPNILINRIPGYIRKPFFQIEKSEEGGVRDDHADEVLEVKDKKDNEEALSILDVDFPIHTGFQLSTLTGPLCAEPMQGVCYIVQGVEIHQEESYSIDGK